MSKKAHLAALAALSCGGPGDLPDQGPATAAPDATQASDNAVASDNALATDDLLPACARYVSMPQTYGYCVYKMAGGFQTAEEVLHHCSTAGEWEEQCRHAWVAGRHQPESGFSTQHLLDVCGDNPDCTFELIDFRPLDDVSAQMDRCGQYTGRYAPDCAGHAMQRWWIGKPDIDEFNRVAHAPTAYPDKVGYYLGASVACQQIGECTGTPRVEAVCQGTVDHLTRRPDLCPRAVPKSLRPDSSAGDRQPSPGTPPASSNQGATRGAPPAGNPPGHPNLPPNAPGPGSSMGPPPGAPGGPSGTHPAQ